MRQPNQPAAHTPLYCVELGNNPKLNACPICGKVRRQVDRSEGKMAHAKPKHTPTPWFIVKDTWIYESETKTCIARTDVGERSRAVNEPKHPQDISNAAFIVQAVNNFDDLITALEECREYLPKGFRQTIDEVIAKAEGL